VVFVVVDVVVFNERKKRDANREFDPLKISIDMNISNLMQ
jgi:hypothetical protein